jgi:hypothetical protein
VSVPTITCTSPPPSADTCAWTLSLHCEGRDGERIDLDATLNGSGNSWTSTGVTTTLLGLPPARLTCAATSNATTQ